MCYDSMELNLVISNSGNLVRLPEIIGISGTNGAGKDTSGPGTTIAGVFADMFTNHLRTFFSHENPAVQ